MNIGVVGRGFVGTALCEGMRHAFEVWSYDKAKGWAVFEGEQEASYEDEHADALPFSVMLDKVNGPIFIAVPTPMKADGSCDVSIVKDVIRRLNDAAKDRGHPVVVVIKSTVIPGTTAELDEECDFLHVCFNPEFLTERASVEDFKNQDRIIIGGPRTGTAILKQVYETAYPEVPVTKTSSTIAEMVKYTTNCFLAVKVAMANELKQVCDHFNDVDYDKVIEYATKDRRLGLSHWSVPGPDGKMGFGGSCFPKDLNALMHRASEIGVEPKMMRAAWEKNLEVRPEKDWEELKGRAVVE